MPFAKLGEDALAKLDVEPNLIALSNINKPEMDWIDLLCEVTDATPR